MPPALAASRRDAWIALFALFSLLLWEASGLDLVLTRWIATPQGFPWRDSLLAGQLLHNGGRALAWAVMVLFVWDALRPFAPGPSRVQRAQSIAVVLAALVLVPLIKRFSATSCPWDLAEFGGRAAYLPHWLIGVTDGGPGHCFPSGHAVAAFAFFSVYFLWRHYRPRVARFALVAVLGLGLVFGWAQWVRGAHFVSHTLWSAWLCWVIAAIGSRAWPAEAIRLIAQPLVEDAVVARSVGAGDQARELHVLQDHRAGAFGGQIDVASRFSRPRAYGATRVEACETIGGGRTPSNGTMRS